MAYVLNTFPSDLKKKRVNQFHTGATSFTATGLPPGLTLDGTSSRVTGTIAGYASGNYGVTLFVKNPNDVFESTSIPFTWSITAADLDLSNLVDGSIGLQWVELYHVDVLGAAKTYVWASVDLVDDGDYYGGFKEGRVASWGDVGRGLSDERGLYESTEFTFVVSDTDREIRKLLDSKFAKVFQNRMVLIRMIDDASRRAKATPYLVVRGVVRDYRPRSPLHFEFVGRDQLSTFIGAGATQKEIPNRKLTRADFDLPNAVINFPVPICYGKLNDEDVKQVTVSSTTVLPPVVGGLVLTDNVSFELVGAPGTTPYVYTVTGLKGQGGVDATNPAQDNDHYQEFIWGQVFIPNGPAPNEISSSRFIRVLWNNVGEQQREQWWYGGQPVNPPGAQSRVYGRLADGPQQLLVGLGTQSAKNQWSDDGRPPRAPLSTPPGNNLSFEGEAITVDSVISIDSGRGVIPTIYVGKRNMGGSDFNEFLICGHAIKKIHGWYLGGVRQPVGPANELDPAKQTFLVPGYAAYHSRLAAFGGAVNTYMDYNGRRYTSIFFLSSGGGAEELTLEEWMVQHASIPDPWNINQLDMTIAQEDLFDFIYKRIDPSYTGANESTAAKMDRARLHRDDIVETTGGEASGEVIVEQAISGVAPLTVNIDGIEFAADGTGALIDQLADIYKHFVVNFAFQDWQSGAWLTEPIWEAGLDPPALQKAKIDLASFDTMKVVHQRRLTGGYTGGIMFGSPTARLLALKDALAQLNLSCECQCGFNRHSQFFVTIFDESISLVDNAVRYTQADDILKSTMDVEAEVEKVENEISFVWARRYATEIVATSTGGYQAAEWLKDKVISDAEAIALLQETRRGPRLELWGVRDDAIAEDIARRRMRYFKVPPQPVRLVTTVKGLQNELGDIVLVDSIEGGGPTGWTGRPLRIQRFGVNPGKFTVTWDALDVWRLYSTNFILGDETAHAATWTSADARGKLRGYLCDEVSGAFSNGEEGKRLG